MNFWKTFFVTLAIYLGLNTVFVLISVYAVPTSPMYLTTDVWLIVTSIFMPIFVAPWDAWIHPSGIVGIMTSADLLGSLMLFLGLVIPPVVAGIVAAKLGDSQMGAFSAWFFTALLTCVLYLLFLALGFSLQLSASLEILWLSYAVTYGELGAIIAIFLSGIINGFFYGSFTLLLAKKWI